MLQATLVGLGRGIASDGKLSHATRQIAEAMAALSPQANPYHHAIASGGYSCRMLQPPRLAREATGMYQVFGLEGGTADDFQIEVQSLDSIGNFVLMAARWPRLVMKHSTPVTIVCAARTARRARFLARRIWGQATSGPHRVITIKPVHIDQSWRDSARELVIEAAALIINRWHLRHVRTGDIPGALKLLRQRPEYATLDLEQIP